MAKGVGLAVIAFNQLIAYKHTTANYPPPESWPRPQTNNQSTSCSEQGTQRIITHFNLDSISMLKTPFRMHYADITSNQSNRNASIDY